MIMPDSGCRGSGNCLHHLTDNKGDEDNDYEFKESDPSGRYGRYREILGKGAFKTVYKAFDKVDGIEVAWNQIKVQDVLRTPEDLERLYSEVHLLKTLKHKHIIKFYHAWVDTNTKNINFITEIFTSGTLRQYRKRHRHVDLKAIKNWSRQILRGLLYLHSHDPPIIHRDLKCDNIFINGNQGEVKIGDLGLAAVLCQAHAAHSVIGTPEFMAPELYEEEYTELVDIYSFGMCLLEMVTFEYPYSECTNAAQIYKKVTSGKKPAVLNRVKDPELRQFVEKCLATARRRLSARELLMDPFLLCDEDRDPSECFPDTFRAIGDMDNLGTCNRPALVCKSLAGSNLRSSLPEYYRAPVANLRRRKVSEQFNTKIPVKMPPSSNLKEDKPAWNKDFRHKGKNRIVYLKLRIADTEGQVRMIQFPFDIDADTALCVASEMVAELDLIDQDVIKIAEMMDSAILTIFPEWRPGVAIDEACGEGEEHVKKASFYSDNSRTHWTPDHVSVMSSESDQSQYGSMSWHDSPAIMSAGSALHPQIENIIHGRFKEVMYHHRPDHSLVEEHHSILTEESGKLDPAASISRVNSSNHKSDALFSSFGTSPRGAAADLNQALESNRNIQSTSCSRLDAKGGTDVDNCGVVVDNCMGAKLENYSCTHNIQDALKVGVFDNDYSGELVTRELENLALRYGQELRDLQHKHEAALLELRNRCKHWRASPAYRRMQKYDSGLSSLQKEEQRPNSSNEPISNKYIDGGHLRDNDIRDNSDRISLKQLTSLFAKVDTADYPGSSKDSGINGGHLLSSGEAALSTSLKLNVFKPAVANFAGAL